jgi:hypothetical protein
MSEKLSTSALLYSVVILLNNNGSERRAAFTLGVQDEDRRFLWSVYMQPQVFSALQARTSEGNCGFTSAQYCRLLFGVKSFVIATDLYFIHVTNAA